MQSITTNSNSDSISMVWHYTSASIRLVPDRDTALSHSLSAIYIADIADNSVVDSFCLSVCHVPLDQVETHRIYVSVPHVHGDGNVIWLDATLEAQAPVFLKNDPLYLYIKYALEHGFNFLPLDTLAGHSMVHDVNLIKVLCRNIYTENSGLFRVFNPVSAEVLTQITVRSAPFNFTNGPLFADFVSVGSLNYVLRDNTGCHGYLSDIKYLENMSGALVTTKQGSLGLLLGNLRKLNGDGDLIVIAPWDRLLSLLDLMNPTSKLTQQWNLQILQKLDRNETVFPLTLSRGGHVVSWGSCILLNLHTLVTNAHVVQHLGGDILGNIIVNHSSVNIDDAVTVPFENLDLAFILLSVENQVLFAGIQPAKLAFASTLQVGDPVTAAGYGLVFNAESTEPLRSSGYVSAKVYQKPFEESRKIPCMLISSAACWNGSSGGGLFNSRGSLVGIICSNAQVFVPDINGNVASKTEKVPLFCLSIPLELVLECYRVVERGKTVVLNPNVEKAWKLESFHDDVFEREAKL